MNCNICGEFDHSIRVKMDSGITYVKCNTCGVAYQNPLPELSIIQNLYEKDDESYYVDEKKRVDYIRGEPWLRGTARFYISLIKRYYKRRSLEGVKVLDFGCATGVFLSEIQKLGCRVRGIELSKWASNYARSNFGIDVFNDDIFNLNFQDESFDIITVIHSIEHLPDPTSVIKRLSDWLKPCGLLVIATPDVNSIGERLFKEKWQYYLPNEHLYLFNSLSIKHFLSRLNLKLLKIEPYLWRRRTYPEAFMILGIKYCLYGVIRLTKLIRQTDRQTDRQNIHPPNGTSKDGMVVFAIK